MQIFSTLWFLIPIIILASIIRTSWFKGVMGEFRVNLAAKWLLDKQQYHLMKNVTLPTETGTTQVDHIIVSVFGVFVIETKNMKGWIFGSKNQRMWTQTIFRYSKKFQNPLHQNYKHIKTLESLLGLDERQIHSVIVFVGGSTFKTEMPEDVTYGRGYIRYIKSKQERVLTQFEVNKIIEKIESGRLTSSFKTNREHVKHVRNIVAQKESNTIPKCPKCSGSMVVRKANKGQNVGKMFWGCAKFPRCRGILNVT